MTGRTCIRTGELARHINGNRLWHRLMSLAELGASSGGGIDRQALSDAEIAARGRVVRWGREIGLEAATDPVANLFLSYKGTEPDLPPVFVGSHIDTQPTGGKFDGALGVLAALESIEAMIARGVRPRRTIEIVAWMNEEGSRFAPGMMDPLSFVVRGNSRISWAYATRPGLPCRLSSARFFQLNHACPSAPSEQSRRPFSRPTSSKALFWSLKKRPSG